MQRVGRCGCLRCALLLPSSFTCARAPPLTPVMPVEEEEEQVEEREAQEDSEWQARLQHLQRLPQEVQVQALL